jgi:hypothetical protein
MWLLRDRDAIYGGPFQRRVAGMSIREVLSSPLSPWQNPDAERLIGSIRREGLDHMIVLGERRLRYGGWMHVILVPRIKDACVPSPPRRWCRKTTSQAKPSMSSMFASSNTSSKVRCS